MFCEEEYLMKNRKNILFLLPTLAICLSLLIFPVYAAGFSGECGDNVVWNLTAYDCGTLQISGFGEMDDWDWDATPSNIPPWAKLTRDFVALQVQNGVTHIGDDAFAGCRYLASVYFPDSVTSIGNDAFYACHALRTGGVIDLFDLPAGIISIGEHAFHGCGDINRISLPDTLEYIGNDAFYDCGSITASLSRSLYNKYDFDKIFSGNTEVTFEIREDGSPIISNPGNPDGTCGNNVKWTLENGTLTINGTGNMADYSSATDCPWHSQCEMITSVVINNGVTSIGDSAFCGCTRLTSVTIPNSVTSIGRGAFSCCKGLTSVAIPSGVTSIEKNAFEDCMGLTSVTIPDSVTSIGERAFFGCTGLTSITIPSGVVDIGGDAFRFCENLTSVNLSYGITSIAEGVFSGCVNLTNINIPGSVVSIGPGAFDSCRNLTSIDIPSSVTSIGNSAFQRCKSLTSVTILGSLTSIGPTVFYSCSSLSSIIIPDSVTSIEEHAFYGCTSLKDVYYSGSEAQWEAIKVGTYNTPLLNATIHFAQEEPTPASYTVTFNANGGIVSPTSMTITEGEPYGELPTPRRDKYTFDGWYTSASGGSRVTSSTTVKLTGDQTLYAHWTSAVDPYNLGDETYSFRNFSDSDSPNGHCFGMSITSAGYYNGLLDIGRIGGNANTPLYSFSGTQTVKRPICYYQGIQGSYATRATVAGGSYYLNRRYNIASDWQEVVNYVNDHSYDDTGLLQIGFRKNNQGGHAINFLRYENVNGQDRIYAYDNNSPTQETYFYRDSSGSVRQTPYQTFSGAIDCIALRDCRKYFSTVDDFDATHVLYMAENAASVEGGYTYSYMETASSDEEYIMYEIPANVDRVTVIPKVDNATFIYMDEEYKFGKITDDTRGDLKLASSNENTVGTDSSFQVYEDDSVTFTRFTDVPTNAYYYDAVYWAVGEAIVNGTSPTTFTPDRTCIATEIITLLWRAAGEPSSSAQLPFTVNKGLEYAEGALRWAYGKGMIDANFNQTAPCTRSSAVKFIWQAEGSPAVSTAIGFNDVPAGADYAQAVAWAVSKGVVNGTTPTTFTPDRTCTRAEIVTLLYRGFKQ